MTIAVFIVEHDAGYDCDHEIKLVTDREQHAMSYYDGLCRSVSWAPGYSISVTAFVKLDDGNFRKEWTHWTASRGSDGLVRSGEWRRAEDQEPR